jgi:NADH:ubiquinone oxidoreductase subunit F (NADH-binding)
MMISNTAVLQGEQTIGFERAMLLDQRDAIVALVKGHKQELQVSLERWCNEGRGSVKAMWQIMGAIGQGENQIAVIDLELESHCTS